MTHTVANEFSAPAAPSAGSGLEVSRRYTQPGIDPLDEVRWERRRTVITNPDGSVVFKMDGVEVPAEWSQLATDIVVSKYFRKAGVHGDDRPARPACARSCTASRTPSARRARSRRLLRHRRRTPTRSRPSSRYLLVHQIGAFNSPVWFNCGLFHDYGIAGSGGNCCTDLETGRGRAPPNDSYERPAGARRASSRRSTTT